MKHKVLLEPLIDGVAHKMPVQGKRFTFAIRVTNRGDHPSGPFTITSVKLHAEANLNMYDDFGKRSFFVATLNPGESLVVPIGENGQFMYGLLKVEVMCSPSDKQDEFTWYQRNPFSGSVTDLDESMRWVDFLYMKSSAEDAQERSNRIMLWLNTFLAFLAAMQIMKLFEPEISAAVSLFTTHNTSLVTQLVSLAAGVLTGLIVMAQEEKALSTWFSRRLLHS